VREGIVGATEALRAHRPALGEAAQRAIVLAVRQALREAPASAEAVRGCVERFLAASGRDSHGRVALSPYAYLRAAIPRAARDEIDRALDAAEATKVAALRRP